MKSPNITFKMNYLRIFSEVKKTGVYSGIPNQNEESHRRYILNTFKSNLKIKQVNAAKRKANFINSERTNKRHARIFA